MAINKATGKPYASSAKATAKWQKNHLRQIKFNLNYDTDADVIEKLDSTPNKQGYIKDLIRADIEKEKKNESDEI